MGSCNSMAKFTDTALGTTVSTEFKKPLMAGNFGHNISPLYKSDKLAFDLLILSLYFRKRSTLLPCGQFIQLKILLMA